MKKKANISEQNLLKWKAEHIMNKEIKRCFWAKKDDFIDKEYHDKQWGRPEHNENMLFEMLILEGMQAGLTWSMILKKRDNFRKAFDNFDPYKMAKYNAEKVEKLLKDKSIVRNKLKINAAISNAKAYIKLKEEFGGLDNFMWKYVDNKPIKNKWKNFKEIPSETPLSKKISADLKKIGFKFVGPVIIYAYMQSIGMVNDHTTDCFCYNSVN